MADRKYLSVFPLAKGNTSKQAHAMLPQVDGKTTYEEEQGRQGFFGKVSHLYHTHPPTGWTKIEGPLKPELINTSKLEPTDQIDPWGSPVTFLQNHDVQLKTSRRSKPMPFYYRNAEGDDVWFVHRGEGVFETIYGPLTFKRGDYIVIPRGALYRVIPTTTDNFFLIIESREEIQIPDRGMLGPNAQYDLAMIETPDPKPILDQDGKEWVVRIKRNNLFTDMTFPYNPIDVIGWKGDVTPWKLNIHDFRPIKSHRYHLPPSVHTTFISEGFVICSFVPRPFEMSDDAIKIPFFHSNVEYDEVIFYHEGDFFSRDNIGQTMVTLHPYGITHGPHPKALQNMLVQKKPMTDEYAVMVDARNPLEVTPEGRKASDPDYWKAWMKKV